MIFWEKKVDGKAAMALMAAAVLAWVPFVQPYVFIGDDFPAKTYLSSLGELKEWITQLGIFRVLGFHVASTMLRAAESGSITMPVLMVLIHGFTSFLFFKVCRNLFENPKLALLLALGFAVAPFHYQAIYWMQVYYFVTAFAGLLLTILVVLVFASEARNQAVGFTLLFFITLVSNLLCEYVVFCFAAVGTLIWFRHGLSPRLWLASMRRYWSAWGPTAGALVFVAIFLLMHTPDSPKQVSIHLPAFLSVWARQYSNLFVFEPWLAGTTRGLLFHGWSWWHGVLVIILAVLLFWGLLRFWRLQSPASSAWDSMGLAVAILLIMIGAAAVHVAAGGYGVDARKKYALIALLFLTLGCIVNLLRGRTGPAVQFSPSSLITISVLYGIFVVTTWLVIGITRFEAQRYTRLATFLGAHPELTSVQIQLEPNLYSLWPHAEALWGNSFYDEVVLNEAMHFRWGRHVNVNENPSSKKLLVRFNEVQFIR